MLQALNASSAIWNAHLLNSTEPALDLNDPTIVESIIQDAAGHVYATKDYLLPSQLNQLSSMQYTAAAAAAANLDILTESANDMTTLAKTSYYAQETVRTACKMSAPSPVRFSAIALAAFACNLCMSV